jgi:hypothetical protein
VEIAVRARETAAAGYSAEPRGVEGLLAERQA